jgi:hypothetical protein
MLQNSRMRRGGLKGREEAVLMLVRQQRPKRRNANGSDEKARYGGVQIQT